MILGRSSGSASAGRIAVAQAKSETIAIVDDDLNAREGVHRWLQAIGLQVETFASAAAFLSGAPESFARLILDQHMPEMTGLELAQKLRASGILMPIMLLTGDLTPGVVSRAQRLGIEKVLEKPPRLEELSAFCRP
jgi:FixJ family two-component response regulator